MSEELHATFVESSPGGSHALPLVAPPVAQRLAMPPVAQTVACPWPCMVDAVAANDPPKPYRRGSLGSHTRARDVVFTGTRHTRPTKTPTFPHQHTEKSPHNQHVLSFNPKPYRRGSLGSHTRARDVVFTGTRHTRPTKIPTFPHDQAEKSL